MSAPLRSALDAARVQAPTPVLVAVQRPGPCTDLQAPMEPCPAWPARQPRTPGVPKQSHMHVNRLVERGSSAAGMSRASAEEVRGRRQEMRRRPEGPAHPDGVRSGGGCLMHRYPVPVGCSLRQPQASPARPGGLATESPRRTDQFKGRAGETHGPTGR